MQYLAIACRVTIAVVFTMAAAGKLGGRRAYVEFVRSLEAMKILPRPWVRPAAMASVLGEAAIVPLVLVPLPTVAAIGCGLAILLTLTFTAVVIANLRSGNRAPCRCFGRSSTPLGIRHLVRNAILLVVSVAALGLSLNYAELSADLAPTLVAVLAGLFIGLVTVALDDIAELITSA